MTLQKVKVYELAKELGMDSITLLDKLKQLDIDVKNHMSSLGSEEVKAIREAITKEQALLNKASRTTKKSADLTAQKKVGTTVIRRRAKPTEESAPSTSIAVESESTAALPSQATGVSDSIVPVSPGSTTEPVTQQTEAAHLESQSEPPSSASVTRVDSPSAVQAPAAPTSTIVRENRGERPSAPTATATRPPVLPKPLGSPVSPSSSSSTTGSRLKFPSLLGARSEGMTTTKLGSILNIVKEEPRRRTPAPRPNVRPNIPGQPPQVSPRTGPGIVNLGKEAIDRLAEEESSYKKKGTGGRTERDRGAVDVRVADYRAKKELVFLPKKKKVPTHKEIKQTEITTPAAHKRVVKIENSVSVSELANRIGVKTTAIIKKLIGMGVMATLNHNLDIDTATLIANEYGYEVENVAFKEENLISQVIDKAEDLQPRPPIVTVMGHVDHGKTSLLDSIRSTSVAAGEAGGITQHIGAYTVQVDKKPITFIDTPGHEAFTVMRARGANVTDIVILVVAADDGVMPQTREAVDHARAANVPIIVAVNKIDKPGANPDKVIKGLSELGLVPEAWGGENIFVNVSALKKTGINELLESILLQAEVLDLKANSNRAAEGTVLEARLDRGKGPVVDILVKKGLLKIGDIVVAGQYYGRVKALTDDKGKTLKSVGPAYAAELLGLEGVPLAGDSFHAMTSEAEARQIAEHRASKTKNVEPVKATKMSLEDLFSKVQQGDLKELAVLLKTDVFGSAEAIRTSLSKLSTEKVKVKVLSASPGGISESDVMLASASNAIIIGFNVRPETKARALAEAEGIEVKCYSIIYELLDDVKKAMVGLLDKKAVEKYMGRAEVREIFNVPKIGTIAGCAVIDGKVTRGCQVRLLRDSRVVYTGKLSSLRRFKDDAKEVAQGYECGIGIENFNDLKQGDIIEAFSIEMVVQDIGVATADQAAAKASPHGA